MRQILGPVAIKNPIAGVATPGQNRIGNLPNCDGEVLDTAAWPGWGT
jgi:hypothetical protein